MSKKKREKEERDEFDDVEEEEVRRKKVRILGALAGIIVAAAFYLGIPYFMNEYLLNVDSE